MVALAAGIGLGIGLGSDPEGMRGASRYANLAGTWFGTCLYAFSGATLLDEFKRPWIPVLIRVVGSLDGGDIGGGAGLAHGGAIGFAPQHPERPTAGALNCRRPRRRERVSAQRR